MFTRLVIGKEWALRSMQHLYLRVTDAKGLQRSTYRLQLPYRYGVPLMMGSASLHWLVSNTIYILVTQREYFRDLVAAKQIESSHANPNLPEGSPVSVGYSVLAVVTMACGLLIGFTLPMIWNRKRLPGMANLSDCNSFAISASCHISPLFIPTSESDGALEGTSRIDLGKLEAENDNEIEMTLIPSVESRLTPGNGKSRLEMNAQSRLKWGVVEMPLDWSSQYTESYEQVAHISFGTNEDQIEEPRHEHWYA